MQAPFTGALQRRSGRFESADGGTIFLDEVGDLAVEAQVALLRVLQEREFERVGGSRPIPVDVRVLAATHRDLTAAMAQGAFRQDLFYRLNVFPIQIPPLRARADDIPLLVEYLVERYGEKAGKKIRNVSKRTLELFQGYDWPGNIRELQNVIKRAVVLCEGETFAVDETWLKRVSRHAAGPTVAFVPALVEREKELIEAALVECHGRIAGPTGAAAKLGIPRQTRILNGSVVATLGPPGSSAYGASKGAIHAMARTLAEELSRSGIRVNVVVPGATLTPIWGRNKAATAQDVASEAARRSRVPLGRLGEAEDIAKAELFLASDDSSYVQGTELVVDGETIRAPMEAQAYRTQESQ
jgi:NAD(P)-dependent dehydrogenase (short-subunit alcohol dehydrogenase family)